MIRFDKDLPSGLVSGFSSCNAAELIDRSLDLLPVSGIHRGMVHLVQQNVGRLQACTGAPVDLAGHVFKSASQEHGFHVPRICRAVRTDRHAGVLPRGYNGGAAVVVALLSPAVRLIVTVAVVRSEV